MKTVATVKNAIAAIIYYLISIIGGILLRKAVILFLGIQYQGADGLFSNIITLLSIAELGIGPAVVCNLYEPLSRNDRESVKSLMAFYRSCYLCIGAAVFLIGLAAVPVLPFLVKDYSLPYPLVLIYSFYLIDAAVSYVFSYRRSILLADQKNYMVSLADVLYVVCVKAVQILILWKTGSYLWFLASMVLLRLAENAAIYLYTERTYPYLKEEHAPLNRELLEDIIRKVRGAFCHKIGYFVVLGTDNILISKFFGLVYSGIYSNYWVIINAVQNLCTKTVSASTAGIGHLLAEKEPAHNRRVFEELQWINVMLSNFAAAGICSVCSDTVEFLFGGQYRLDDFTVSVLALNLAFACMRSVYASFKEAAGIYYEDRFVPLIESAVNIAASVFLLRTFGLAGIFMGTIVSSLTLYLYTYPVLVYKKLLSGSLFTYFRDAVWQLGVFGSTLYISGKLSGFLSGEVTIGRIAAKAAAALLAAGAVFFFGYGVWKPERRAVLLRLRSLLKR